MAMAYSVIKAYGLMAWTRHGPMWTQVEYIPYSHLSLERRVSGSKDQGRYAHTTVD